MFGLRLLRSHLRWILRRLFFGRSRMSYQPMAIPRRNTPFISLAPRQRGPYRSMMPRHNMMSYYPAPYHRRRRRGLF
jgi:hypothetical protein